MSGRSAGSPRAPRGVDLERISAAIEEQAEVREVSAGGRDGYRIPSADGNHRWSARLHKYGVDVSVIVRLRALAKDAAIAAFTSAKPGRPVSAEAIELELLRAENDRLSAALKEMAIELALHRGKQRSGFSARFPRA